MTLPLSEGGISMVRDHKTSGGGVIIATLLVAAWLTLLPLPDVLAFFRPQWLVLVLIYWAIALPHRIGAFSGFALGVFTDVLLGSPLGQHAMAMALVAWLAQAMHKRMRVFPPLQQCLVVFLLVGVSIMVTYLLQGTAGRALYSPLLMQLGAFASALLWRPVYSVLRLVRQHFLVR